MAIAPKPQNKAEFRSVNSILTPDFWTLNSQIALNENVALDGLDGDAIELERGHHVF